MLFSLLVHCGIYKEIYGNRLPVGHTHIDVDQRHQIYTTYLGGRGEAGGAYDSILTFSKFDKAIAEAYKTDNFTIKRKYGLLDVKSAWEGVLACSNFSPQRKDTPAAIAQGGADHEPMCFRFFKGEMDGKHQVLMQYRYSEADPTWLPYDYPGISVLENYDVSPEDSRKNCLSILQPKIWDYGGLKRNIFRNWSLSESETEEWNNFFDSIPTEANDILAEKLFKWNLEYLFARKCVTDDSQPFSDPGEHHEPDEIVIWKHFTKSRLKEDRLIRGIKHKQKKNKVDSYLLSDSSASFSDDVDDSNDGRCDSNDEESSKICKVAQHTESQSNSSRKVVIGIPEHVHDEKRLTRSQSKSLNQVSS